MGIFPEDHEIRVSTLIKLWVAEGFLKPSEAHSLEEVAQAYFEDLVDRNLILARTWNWNGKIKTCIVHDLLRDLCLRLVEKEKFFCVHDDASRDFHNERRVVNYESINSEEKKHVHEAFGASKSARPLRFLLCKWGLQSSDFKLLKLLNFVQVIPNDIYHVRSIEAIFQQANIRHFCLKVGWHRGANATGSWFYPNLSLPSSISLLWNLHTVIIRGPLRTVAPSEIWEMPQLRHLLLRRIYLPDPCASDGMVLPNLQTLSKVEDLRLSEEVCKRIPNIKKLRVKYNKMNENGCKLASSHYYLQNIGHFHSLESLRCSFDHTENWSDFMVSATFPSSLKKLSLECCGLRWENLTMIGSLPCLEVLKLDWKSVKGSEWNPVEGEFLRLRYLQISGCIGLTRWNAESSHFPVLEKLILKGLVLLKEIPSDIGEIPTLESIVMEDCSVSAAMSAMRILVEQEEELGNHGLQLQLRIWNDEHLKSFKKLVKEEGLKSPNLCLRHKYRERKAFDF